ncbi:MAG: hypothetical protein LUB61_04235, partial [Eggerthellaceae bacterium]|nr:hypothetical protein [Eggerthellaceae bacterium]
MALKHATEERRRQNLEASASRAQTAQHSSEPHHPGGGHPGGPAHHTTEKARDFSGTIVKLLKFMGRFKIHITIAIIFAIGSTIFNIVGPRVLSTATTELFNGIVAKIAGTGSIDYTLVGQILIFTLFIYLFSAACSFVQSWLMTWVSQKTCYDMRRAIAEKIDRMPFGFFEKTSIGDTLSRITNDVDTLGQSLN